ncbi:hypothetical protein DPX16_10313 [Anabarilius grahami]|uniref:Uncharacterized protein n=1 Tax=Anabarilius grahami TaxID=495550 RepID=A0A3N0YCS2_ANAGA|nr:hypothetical protein DPX16_10313 [Anabarilius grahami]
MCVMPTQEPANNESRSDDEPGSAGRKQLITLEHVDFLEDTEEVSASSKDRPPSGPQPRSKLSATTNPVRSASLNRQIKEPESWRTSVRARRREQMFVSKKWNLLCCLRLAKKGSIFEAGSGLETNCVWSNLALKA